MQFQNHEDLWAAAAAKSYDAPGRHGRSPMIGEIHIDGMNAGIANSLGSDFRPTAGMLNFSPLQT